MRPLPQKAVAHAPLIVICTGTYWRNAMEYRSRTYRHFGWDNGTILANALAVSTALGLPAKVITGFVDQQSESRLLDLDARRSRILGTGIGSHEILAPPVPSENQSHSSCRSWPTSKEEVDYPPMRQMHEASSLLESKLKSSHGR